MGSGAWSSSNASWNHIPRAASGCPSQYHQERIDMKRFALIGAGFIGQVHAQNLAAHPGIDFRLIYDLDTGRATELANKTGASSPADIKEVFSSSHIDAVFIASSTDPHSEFLR